MKSTSLYIVFWMEMRQRIHFLHQILLQIYGENGKKLLFWPKISRTANKNSFWLKILKFGKNHLKALTTFLSFLITNDIFWNFLPKCAKQVFFSPQIWVLFVLVNNSTNLNQSKAFWYLFESHEESIIIVKQLFNNFITFLVDILGDILSLCCCVECCLLSQGGRNYINKLFNKLYTFYLLCYYGHRWSIEVILKIFTFSIRTSNGFY